MKEMKEKSDSAQEAADFAELRLENETLAQQIRRLIKAESKLYAYQEQLDAQLREYKGLYELNRRLIGTLNIQEMFQHTCKYVINGLEYERVLIFLQVKETEEYAVSAIDGYYDPGERRCVAGLVIKHDEPILLSLAKGDEYLICGADSAAGDLAGYRQKFAMNEFLIYPLVSHALPLALLVVGNSSENSGFYHRVVEDEGTLLGIGNLVGLLASALENRILYENMNRALGLVQQAEAKYRDIFENAAEGIFQTSVEGRFISCNPATAAILGYGSPDDLIASVTDLEKQLYVNPQRRGDLLEMLRNRENVKNFEVELYRKDGRRQWVLLSVNPTFDESGNITYLNGIILDIAERKRAEELTKSSLREKEILLKEIHHRVKNNLQIINTLLELQSFSISDVRARKFFGECQDRIRSIALIHERLYNTVDFVSIDFAEYLRSLVHQLFGMYTPGSRISLNLLAAGTTIGIDQAIPCGLIVNELVTNSLKYAFPDGRKGELMVHLDMDEGHMITMTVGDNGVGLPTGLDYRNTETLGLQLVTLLVKQIKGNIELQEGDGTVFTIRFLCHPPS